MAIIEDAKSKGAKVLCGGVQPNQEGAFLMPTVITEVTTQMRAFSEELFGPVAVIYKVADEQEAITLANNSIYGLGSSIFSKDVKKAKQLANQLVTGMTFINKPTFTEPFMPFGGVKKSGFGRELFSYGFEEFLNKKLICN